MNQIGLEQVLPGTTLRLEAIDRRQPHPNAPFPRTFQPLEVSPMATNTPIRVLLIDASDTDATKTQGLLRANPALPFSVDHVRRLVDALIKLQSTDYDVTLLDVNLPDAKGLKSFDQIRALDARLPVVVLTASDDEELGISAIESGVQDFMAKGHVTGETLCRSLRFAIARQRKVMGYQAAADTDPLTGMPNRRHLQSRFLQLVANCRRKGLPMSMALLDVDHFKKVNDRHGHFIGDAVLKIVATTLTDSLPAGMSAARFGGEEFALLMPGLDVEAACQLVDSILTRLAETTMQFDELSAAVTASAGVIEVETGDSWDESFIKADVALYEAKNSGRNQLCRGKANHRKSDR